mmetsp:Transcript_9814/g.24671  ORF Transcript_9814/g.24671 Transcript_9814/m.24671 type:complete len:346 (+) Transcript_9814:28-1065(+)
MGSACSAPKTTAQPAAQPVATGRGEAPDAERARTLSTVERALPHPSVRLLRVGSSKKGLTRKSCRGRSGERPPAPAEQRAAERALRDREARRRRVRRAGAHGGGGGGVEEGGVGDLGNFGDCGQEGETVAAAPRRDGRHEACVLRGEGQVGLEEGRVHRGQLPGWRLGTRPGQREEASPEGTKRLCTTQHEDVRRCAGRRGRGRLATAGHGQHDRKQVDRARVAAPGAQLRVALVECRFEGARGHVAPSVERARCSEPASARGAGEHVVLGVGPPVPRAGDGGDPRGLREPAPRGEGCEAGGHVLPAPRAAREDAARIRGPGRLGARAGAAQQHACGRAAGSAVE